MSPWLIGKARLECGAPSRTGAIWSTLAVVTLAVSSILAVAHEPLKSTGTPVALPPPVRVVPLRAAASAITAFLPGTRIPLPAPTFGLRARTTATEGEFIYRPSARFSRATSLRLLRFYETRLNTGGWTIQGQAQPDPDGAWALNASLTGQEASIRFDTAPFAQLTVDYCPPAPYC